MQYLQCITNGDIAVLHKVIDIIWPKVDSYDEVPFGMYSIELSVA